MVFCFPAQSAHRANGCGMITRTHKRNNCEVGRRGEHQRCRQQDSRESMSRREGSTITWVSRRVFLGVFLFLKNLFQKIETQKNNITKHIDPKQRDNPEVGTDGQ